MGTTIKIFQTVEQLSQFFAEKIVAGIAQIPPGNHYSIALSGGLTPRKVFEYIALNFNMQIDWHKVLVYWSDERCVDPESEESNYRMAKESLLDKVPIPETNIFRIHGESHPSAEAERYSEIIRKHVSKQNNIPQFDLMMLGLGDDGHTVSIFPGSLHLYNSCKLCEVAVNPYSKQKRITVTGQIINHAKTIIFLVTGATKSEVVAQIIEKKENWDKLPAAMVKPIEGELIWLLDAQAADKLSVKLKYEDE